jgi:hypothetical protein
MSDAIFWLGPAPAEAACVQVGSPDYARDARTECRAYIDAIRKVCGPEPDGAHLTVKSQPHEFGSYYEVAVVFDPDDSAAAEYASKVDESAPTRWSDAGMEPPQRSGMNR